MTEALYDNAAELIRNARRAVALTGAGISTPSGIPDFRSPNSGLWSKVDPMDVATIETFQREPKRFFDFMSPLAAMFAGAHPNPAHVALAELEKAGRIQSVITQNIDNLHQRAGSTDVIELHGNADRAYCMNCRAAFSSSQFESMVSEGVPRCACGGVIKPDVILFGEALPEAALQRAMEISRDCDLMLVLGSSLTVMPASFLPQVAHQANARIIMINILPTYMDHMSSVLFHDHVEVVLPEILRRVASLS